MYKKSNWNLKKSAFIKSALLSSFFLALACGGPGESKDALSTQCAEDYKSYSALYADEKYWDVSQKLGSFVDRCTGTGFIEQAQWMLAESQFKDQRWIEARGSFSTFALNFPGSDSASTALYKKALSAYNMEYRDSRDQANTSLAINDFMQFINRYPASVLKDSAHFYVQKLDERSLEHDLGVARLYLRMGKSRAASVYFQEILKEYPANSEAENIRYELARCYMDMNQFDRSRAAIKVLEESAQNSEVLSRLKGLKEEVASAEESYNQELEAEKKKRLLAKEDE
jgi:outer membrane protein assembly factor BamD